MHRGERLPDWDVLDTAYLYVTGIYAVLMALIPFFRGAFRVPWVVPLWAALYLVYRFRAVPEKYKFLINGLFLAGCYLTLGEIASTFSGEYHGMDVHRLEVSIFGVLPSRWLQSFLVRPGCPNWFDYPFAVTHSLFFLFPFITPWLVYRKKGLRAMKRAVLGFGLLTTAGYATYILWPLTPPWLLAVDGAIPPLERCVFAAIQRTMPAFLVSSASNTPRAAMPSLHAGVTLLMAMFLTRELGFRRGWWAVLILLVISFEIVYGAEHFIIDIAFGYLYAVVAFLAAFAPVFGRR
jgi:hypothetical protein